MNEAILNNQIDKCQRNPPALVARESEIYESMFSRVNLTLEAALSVNWAVGQSVGPLVGPSIRFS